MVEKIEWSRIATIRFKEITEYLILNWGTQVASDFVITTESKLDLLFHFPFIGSKTNRNSRVRKLFLSKHNRLFYELNESTISIITVFDTRCSKYQ